MSKQKKRSRDERRAYLIGIGDQIARIIEDPDTPPTISLPLEQAIKSVVDEVGYDTPALIRGMWPTVIDHLMA